MAIIEAYGLKKQFKSGKKVVEALCGVDLLVSQGQVFGLLGPNGAGKTTLLRILTTLLPPDAGDATVVGHSVTSSPEAVRKAIGYVSQQGGAENAATGRENLMLQAQLYGMNRAEARARVDELLAAFELEAVADRVVQTYSGGQRRRLDLAMGMVHRPALLFLDEPTVGLDPQSRAHVWDEVRRLHQQGTSVVITTHYLDEADALCQRIAIIDYGRIVAEDTPDALKRKIAGDVVRLILDKEHVIDAQELLRSQSFIREINQEHETLRLLVDQGEQALPMILRMIHDRGLVIRTVTLDRPSLDDVFLRQTGRSLRHDLN
ncbi:MAG: daunorubicin resistance protein DrrA family ABC transporter ATP-binding protein [Herpetosiphonaceae bacterium]|nr:MAG: daunorubicin resistance protein DrrA family ABC transporter ATP-binding protein [Herpetosiphonaceae bacterium]